MSEEAPTPEQVDEYLKQGGVKCPKCGEHNVEGDSIEVEAGSAYQQMSCTECESRWTDVYHLVAIHDTDSGDEFEGTEPQGGMVPFSFEDWQQKAPSPEAWQALHDSLQVTVRKLAAAKEERILKMIREEVSE